MQKSFVPKEQVICSSRIIILGEKGTAVTSGVNVFRVKNMELRCKLRSINRTMKLPFFFFFFFFQ